MVATTATATGMSMRPPTIHHARHRETIVGKVTYNHLVHFHFLVDVENKARLLETPSAAGNGTVADGGSHAEEAVVVPVARNTHQDQRRQDSKHKDRGEDGRSRRFHEGKRGGGGSDSHKDEPKNRDPVRSAVVLDDGDPAAPEKYHAMREARVFHASKERVEKTAAAAVAAGDGRSLQHCRDGTFCFLAAALLGVVAKSGWNVDADSGRWGRLDHVEQWGFQTSTSSWL